MPVSWTIDAENRRVLARLVGDVQLHEMLDVITASTEDPRYRPGFDILSDHTQVGRVVDTGQVHAVVAHLQALADRLAGSRWAIYTRKPASFGMMRMLAVYAEKVPMHVRVFRTAHEAQAWLASPRK